jgi:ribosome biogenesis GTPase
VGEAVEMVGRRVRVRFSSGDERVVPVRAQVVVADRVRVVDGVAIEVLPRDCTLERTASAGTHVACSNATLLVAVSAATDPPFRPGLVDRMLVAASAGGMEAALVLNKCDLGMPEEVLERIAWYESLGYPAFLVSAAQQKGLEPLRALLARHTSVLVGHSGVGKTSLARALIPGLEGAIGELDAWGRGRHTTVGARLVPLPGGGRLIDVPGVREFGVGHVPRQELRAHFPELRELRCRYRDCLHDGEEGCVAEEHCEPERLESYRKLLEETV